MRTLELFKKEKYQILLVVPKYEITSDKPNYNYLFPTGLGYIAGALKKAGYIIDGLNLNHEKGSINKILTNKLNKIKYDFVATGNNALGYWTTKKIIDISRNHPSKPKTILGGPIITSEPKLIFEDLKPDFGVIGEGDECIINLLKALESKKNLANIKSIVFWDKGEYRKTEKGNPPMNLDNLAFPDFKELGFEKWLDNIHTNTSYSYGKFDYPKIYPLIASRSCPFQCTFCYHDNNRYRARSIDNIMEELNYAVKKYKINRIIIEDELFAVNGERVKEFCKRIKKLRKEVGWEINWVPQMRVNNISQSMLGLMKEAGCDIVSYGFESINEKVLKSMKKQITKQEIEKAFFDTLKTGLGVQANFIFGDIAETTETANETLDWWKKNSKGMLYMDFIQPYPGSEIYHHCIRKGIIKDKLKFIQNLESLKNIIWNFTENMTDKEINKLARDIKESLCKYQKYSIPKNIKKTSKNIFEFNITCPHCNTDYRIKNCFIKSNFFFGFKTHCRNCPRSFTITNKIGKLIYLNYNHLKKIRNLQRKIYTFIKNLKR